MSTLQLAVVGWLDELVARHGTTSGPTLPAGTLPRPYPHVNSRNRIAAFGRTNVMSMAASVEAPLEPVRAAAAQQLCPTNPHEASRASPPRLALWPATQGTRACIAPVMCR
jgi:hypothetical protein